MYARRTNMEIEPETEDIDNFDDQKLAQNYYKYHIHPDWLVIRRIINHRAGSGKKKEYLILWRNLPYRFGLITSFLELTLKAHKNQNYSVRSSSHFVSHVLLELFL